MWSASCQYLMLCMESTALLCMGPSGPLGRTYVCIQTTSKNEQSLKRYIHPQPTARCKRGERRTTCTRTCYARSFGSNPSTIGDTLTTISRFVSGPKVLQICAFLKCGASSDEGLQLYVSIVSCNYLFCICPASVRD